MIRLAADPGGVFRAPRLPWILRLYEYVGDDRDVHEFRATHRKSSLVRYGARLALRRLLFPWLLSVARLQRPHFSYERPPQPPVRIRFDPRNGQFESAYAGKFQGRYEPRVAAVLASVVPRGRRAVFYDVGANWGHFSLYLASVLGSELEVHAFEPTPSSFADLRSSVTQAGLADRVHCHHLALGDQDTRVTMRAPRRDMSGLATVSRESTGPDSVPCRPLDSLELPRPDVMKIDVEGYEAAVLRGALEILKNDRPHIVFESSLGGEWTACIEALELLARCGYRLFEPVWELRSGDTSGLSRDDRLARSLALDTIVLRPTTALERNLLPPATDLFACHESRLPELQAS